MSTGMGDMKLTHEKGKMLTINEGNKRKVDVDLHSRKQQKLLQAEQPKTIDCAA